MELLGESVRQKWEDRNWQLALLTKNPMETYQNYKDSEAAVDSPTIIEDLPNKEWLRAE
jgi:hypothetical protein